MKVEKTILAPKIMVKQLSLQLGIFVFFVVFAILGASFVPAVGGMTDSVTMALAATLLILPASLVISFAWSSLYSKSLEYRVTDRRVLINQGIIFKSWKSIPFDKITDVAIKQGPVERHFGIKTLLIQTAGMGTYRAEGTLCGLSEAEKVREKLVEARERYLRSSVKYGE